MNKNPFQLLIFAVAIALVLSSFSIPLNTPSNMEVTSIQQINPSDNDEDQDGVEDEDDRCPGTPRDVIVDANGCPIIG